jgi:hypothetical protein
MGKHPQQRPLTRCICWGTKRSVSSHQQLMHLSHTNLGLCNYLQNFVAISFCTASSAMWAISPMATIYMLMTGGIGGINQNALAEATATMSITLLRLLFVRYVTELFCIARLLLLDYQYHDICLNKEEQSQGGRLQRQNIWINNWTKQECYDFMLFMQVQLYRILTNLALRSWPRKPMAKTRCIPAVSTIVLTQRRSSCSS